MPEASRSRPRAVVLVGGPVAPYSRALRIARALAAEGFGVEIAAIAAPGLPDRETVSPYAQGLARAPGAPHVGGAGTIELRRYRPAGPWRFLGASEGASGAAVRSGASAVAVARGGSGRVSTDAARSLLRVAARPVLTLRRWIFWPHAVRGWWATLARELAPADLYHAFGALAIQPALAARKGAPIGPGGGPARVIYDAIDDIAGSNETMALPGPIRRRIARREREWARQADAIVTVNDTLARRLTSRFGRTDPILVVPNYPATRHADGLGTPSNLLRDAAGLDEATRVVLFQGRLGPGLGLETAAEAVLAVPGAALVLLGFGRGVADAQARDRDPRTAGRHVTLPAVPPDELLGWTASADVMLIPLPPDSPNQRAATPNKFWEALAVGLPVVVVRGLDEMARLVEEHDLGAVATSGSAEDLAAAITSVLDRLTIDGPAWRDRITKTSAERFSWAAAETSYQDLVRQLTPIDRPAPG
ncbi:MAG TPA: glycosyltransferase [Candidatus Bathyarchaeia archaeon]|nr:glycosyltransferase [Candidatus Bathyarchaeia archaeon]